MPVNWSRTLPIALVLADDHPLILAGLEQLFSLEHDFTLLARCMSGEETLQAVRQYRPDVLVQDIHISGKDGLTVLREMQREKLATKVVILTAALNGDEALEALRLGVRGVVLKEMAPQLLVQCIRKVHVGGEWLEKRSVGRALEKILRGESGAQQLARVLTPREMTIVRMVATGLRNKAIADSLSISEGTVKIHLHHIYEKLKVDGRIALICYAQHQGFV
jgi:two-component system, NarL family, nitrate/nitrite response regulator NarL